MILWLIITAIIALIFMRMFESDFSSLDIPEVCAALVAGMIVSLLVMLAWSALYPYQTDQSVTEAYQLCPVYSSTTGKSLGYASLTDGGIMIHFIDADTRDCIDVIPSSSSSTEIKTKSDTPLLEFYACNFKEDTFISQQLFSSVHTTQPKYVLHVPEDKISVADYATKE